jgi:hypothetical protein
MGHCVALGDRVGEAGHAADVLASGQGEDLRLTHIDVHLHPSSHRCAQRIACPGWLTLFIRPIAASLLPYKLGVSLIGKGSIILWLLVIGVNAQIWDRQAGAIGNAASERGPRVVDDC